MGVENHIFEGTAGNLGSLSSWELLRTRPSECFLIPSFIFFPSIFFFPSERSRRKAA